MMMMMMMMTKMKSMTVDEVQLLGSVGQALQTLLRPSWVKIAGEQKRKKTVAVMLLQFEKVDVHGRETRRVAAGQQPACLWVGRGLRR